MRSFLQKDFISKCRNDHIGRDKVRSLHDYVRWVAESMGAYLDDEKINRITNKLVRSKKYNDMLVELEKMILMEKRIRVRNK